MSGFEHVSRAPRAFCDPAVLLEQLTEAEREVLKSGGVVANQELLRSLEARGLVRFTPSIWWLTSLGDVLRAALLGQPVDNDTFNAGVAAMRHQVLLIIDDEPVMSGDPSPAQLENFKKNPVVAMRGAVIVTLKSLRMKIIGL